jgi:hypothetical protein
MKWEFDCQMEVNGIIRQVWTCPSNLFKYEKFYVVTFDLGSGENPPPKGHSYWTNDQAFQKQFPQYQR